ncbi:hypothetical protein V8G54_006902 [Vigna mungo]|uniref:Uncharacterized protein n=1 Tax=Vigna mungo TaxID=3915 RepID=A0AAQ3P0W7_VIGMU
MDEGNSFTMVFPNLSFFNFSYISKNFLRLVHLPRLRKLRLHEKELLPSLAREKIDGLDIAIVYGWRRMKVTWLIRNNSRGTVLQYFWLLINLAALSSYVSL